MPGPPIGDAWFYLGRPKFPVGDGSFDAFGDGLIEPRDTEIALSTFACP